MSKLKKLLPSIFGANKDTKNIADENENVVEHSPPADKCDKGRLEADASPVDDSNEKPPRYNNTPTPSTELTESVVRELSDPNYISSEVTTNSNTGALAVHTNDNTVSPISNEDVGASTMNTMNVHNAQQQMVMQFSNINKLHFGSVYNINTNINAVASSNTSKQGNVVVPTIPRSSVSPDNRKRQNPRKTPTIVTMMQSSEEPNHRILETISTHLGEGWKHIMRELGHSEGQIEQALIDHQMHGGIKEVIYQLLLQWTRDADDGVATLGHITTLLWESNQRDCVQRMKMVYKSNED